jgi:hypothetical protein
MQGTKWLLGTIAGMAVLLGTLTTQGCWTQNSQEAFVRKMQISGEIVKSGQQYIIRGKKPAEIFTILNPYPDQLAKYMGEGKIAEMQVRVVSGDNVEIEKIDGTPYCQDCK